ncbi:uncharacterized protein LOC134178113 [Corticium candelabrum]|uniref:uncharacterized protein LOC134178113 n=1 Tax=Corticium candelabrum TaxID=121492 RepID=UPI002E268885|nr:uncharacterized protein LOC134178113 [Corticium candelabrum]
MPRKSKEILSSKRTKTDRLGGKRKQTNKSPAVASTKSQQKTSRNSVGQKSKTKTGRDKNIVVSGKTAKKWNGLSRQTQEFVCSALDEAAIFVESAYTRSKHRNISKLFASIKQRVGDELKTVKSATSLPRGIQNYYQVSDLNIQLDKLLKGEQQKMKELDDSTEKLEEFIEQKQDQLRELTTSGSGIQNAHTTSSEAKQTLQGEIEAHCGSDDIDARTLSSVEDRLVTCLTL